jgi:hypothetical protein
MALCLGEHHSFCHSLSMFITGCCLISLTVRSCASVNVPQSVIVSDSVIYISVGVSASVILSMFSDCQCVCFYHSVSMSVSFLNSVTVSVSIVLSMLSECISFGHHVIVPQLSLSLSAILSRHYISVRVSAFAILLCSLVSLCLSVKPSLCFCQCHLLSSFPPFCFSVSVSVPVSVIL